MVNSILAWLPRVIKQPHLWAECWSGFAITGFGISALMVPNSYLVKFPVYAALASVSPHGLWKYMVACIGLAQLFTIASLMGRRDGRSISLRDVFHLRVPLFSVVLHFSRPVVSAMACGFCGCLSLSDLLYASSFRPGVFFLFSFALINGFALFRFSVDLGEGGSGHACMRKEREPCSRS